MLKFRKKNSESGEIEISDIFAHGGEHEKRKIEEPVGLAGLKKFIIIITLSILIIVSRTAYLQLVRGSYYLTRAENNRISHLTIKAPRGIIVDKNGEELVRNAAGFNAVIIPAFLPENTEEQIEIMTDCLGKIKIEKDEKKNLIKNYQEIFKKTGEYYLIKENITRDEALSIELMKSECPGFFIEKTAVREYEDPLIFAHLLGYTGKVREQDLQRSSDYLMTDIVGRAGLEEYREKELRGKHGSTYVEVNSHGKILRFLEETNPLPGERLVLGIDKNLQIKLYQSMERILAETGAKKAAAVIIDPRNGLIRSMVSFPSFDNNLFSKKITQEKYQAIINNPAKPLLNRVITGQYAPGSTIKPLLGLAALEEGIVNQTTSFDCHGALKIGDWTFRDWKVHGENINLSKAISQSCDVYFYTIGGGFGDFKGLGVEKIKDYEELFGMGDKTGIDLYGEKEGFIPTPDWKKEAKQERWYIGNTYHISIGQGDVTVTPLQLANYISVIANGGALYHPQIVDRILDSKTGEVIDEIKPEIIRTNFVSSGNIEIVKNAMRETIKTGTAKSLNDLEVDICGKTGTSQIGGSDKTNSWFAAFGPCENPELTIVIIVEEGGESSDAAVPVAKDVFKYYFNR